MKVFWARFVAIMLISVFGVGATGWLYIKHCCDSVAFTSEVKCGQSAVEIDHNCCKEKEETHHSCCENIQQVENAKLPSNGFIHKVDDDGCCVVKSNFFSVPLYRLHSSQEKKVELLSALTCFPVFELLVAENNSFKKFDIHWDDPLSNVDITLFNQSFII